MEADVRLAVRELELKVAERYATKAEVSEVYDKAESTEQLALRIDERLKGIEGSVNRMSGNFEKLFWAILLALLVGAASQVLPW